MEIHHAVQMFLGHRHDRQRSPDTLRQYRRHLNDWHAWRTKGGLTLNLEAVELCDLDGFFSYLTSEHICHQANPYRRPASQPGMAPNSIAAYRRTLRAFWRFCRKRRWISADQADFFDAEGVAIPNIVEEPRPYCDEPTALVLADACVSEAAGEDQLRDRAIILLLWESGLRIDELCNLEDARVDLWNRRAQVRGKGNEYGWVFWSARAGKALIDYLMIRNGPRGCGFFFRSTGPKTKGGAIRTDTVRTRIKRVASRAGIVLPKGAPCHFFRHGFAHHCLDAGLDITQVSQLLRHAKVETSMRYVRESWRRLQKIHRRVFGSLHADPQLVEM